MQVIADGIVPFQVDRKGGAIVTNRFDIWKPTQHDWALCTSLLFQQVTLPEEIQEVELGEGSYTVVCTCRIEESINGVYSFKMLVNGVLIGSESGNVDQTSSPHDSRVYKNQFVLKVQ